ncbi:MAG: isocitrate lyase/PEP mutase family protein [Deltaproteobacteria bacterium]|nr:isocitrate lyase/PEP mutase family protein [Deltaproteobacteria bacterium]
MKSNIYSNPIATLRKLLNSHDFIIMPCCYDALSARLIQDAGFPLTFMSGFAVSAARLGLPDTGLISYGEIADQLKNICSAINIPVIADGDTGYGNAVNVKRTVHGYIQAGAAGIMIEDQKSPKRCGHTSGKEVIERKDAVIRLKAAIEAQKEARANGKDIVIMARTDARATLGLDEAIERARIFSDLGADILFVEAPCSEEEMETICVKAPGCHMANMVEHGKTPLLPPARLSGFGYKIAAYPLTLLTASVYAMKMALSKLKKGESNDAIMDFKELQSIIGFPEYDETLKRLEE